MASSRRGSERVWALLRPQLPTRPLGPPGAEQGMAQALNRSFKRGPAACSGTGVFTGGYFGLLFQ